MVYYFLLVKATIYFFQWSTFTEPIVGNERMDENRRNQLHQFVSFSTRKTSSLCPSHWFFGSLLVCIFKEGWLFSRALNMSRTLFILYTLSSARQTREFAKSRRVARRLVTIVSSIHHLQTNDVLTLDGSVQRPKPSDSWFEIPLFSHSSRVVNAQIKSMYHRHRIDTAIVDHSSLSAYTIDMIQLINPR